MKILFRTDAAPSAWEKEETQGNETPQECAQRIVDYFNSTLKTGESRRTLLEVKEASVEGVTEKKQDYETAESLGKLFYEVIEYLDELDETYPDRYKIFFGCSTGWGISDFGEERVSGSLEALCAYLKSEAVE